MKKLMLGLMLAFAVTAEAAVTIDGFRYELDTESKTATITGYTGSPTKVDVSEVEWGGQRYTVTSVKEDVFCKCVSLTSVSLPNATTIGASAFGLCSSLTSVSLPNATTIGVGAFLSCSSLTSLSLPNATTIGVGAFRACIKLETVVLNWELLASQDREGWALRNEAKLVGPFTEDEIKNATYKVAAVAGEKLIDKENYEKGCVYYGLAPKPEPQIVQEGEIAVKKTELQAAKAEAVTIADGVVSLAVGVCSNGNFTAETKSWAPVELKQENVEVKDGKIVISIPVGDKSGFMILQSGDAKVSDAAVTHEPWYTPTVED